jgi:ferrous iron transport protein A
MDSCAQWHETTLLPLSKLRKGTRGIVSAVSAADVTAVGDMAGSTVTRRLLEIGFVPGERIEIVEEVWPGGDPMAVRVGSSVFALRRREAQAVLIQVESM